MSKAKEMLKIAGFEDTPEGRAQFYKRFPTAQSWEKKYGNGGNVMSYEAGGPTTPMVGPDMYAQGGYTFPQPTGDIFDMMGLPQINAYMHGGDVEAYGSGGGIHIKPSKRGTFTAAAKKHGKSVQAFASQVLANKGNYSPAMVKKANFARNAAKWKHEDGGETLPMYDGGDSIIGGGAGGLNFFPDRKSFIGGIYENYGLDPKRLERFARNSALYPTELTTAGFDRTGITGGIALNRTKNSFYGMADAYLTGSAGKVNTMTRLPEDGSMPGMKSEWREDSQPFASIGVNAETRNYISGLTSGTTRTEDRNRRGFTTAGGNVGVGLQYENNSLSPYFNVNPRIGYNFGKRLLTGKKSPNDQPFTAYAGMNATVNDLPTIAGRDVPWYDSMLTGASKAEWTAGLEGRIGSRNGTWNVTGSLSSPMASPEQNYGSYEKAGTFQQQTGKGPRFNVGIKRKFAEGGDIQDIISTANRYDNWLNPPKYGLGDWIPGVGDAALGVLDTGLSVLGGQDIIGDKQYSDTGFGKTMQDVSHYTGSIAESIVPTVLSYIPGIGQILSPALNAVQMGVDALTPDDIRRMNSKSGRNAALVGMGLDIAGAATSLGTGAAKAGATGAKLAKAANTTSQIARGVKTASDIYNVASDPNASGADWIGAAAGALGTAGSSVGGDMGNTLQTIGKFGKLSKNAINTGQALASGRLDPGQTAASLAGLAGNALGTASSFTGEKGTRALSDINRGLNTAGILANMYSAGRQSSIPGAAGMLPAAFSNYMDYKRAAQERQASFPSMTPMPTPEELGEFYTPTEYLRDGGYFSGNMRKFADGGTTEINVEGNELLVDPSQPGGGGVPSVLANYQNIPAHPEDGSLDPGGNVSAKVGAFVIPKGMKTKYETAVKTNDKLYADALMNNIHRKKQQKEMEQATQQMYAEQEMTNGTPSPFDMFVAQYGGMVPMYGMGGNVPMYRRGDEVRGGVTRDELKRFYREADKSSSDILDTKNWRKAFREDWKKRGELNNPETPSTTIDQTAPGANMFDRSTFEQILPYIGPAAGLAYAAFDKPFKMNAEDYMVKDKVKAYEDEYVPDYDLYNTAVYQMRRMAGGSPAALASLQGLYNRYAKGTAEEKRKVREANQARKMAADVENLKIDAENKKIAMTIADYNEKNKSERSNAILNALFGERGLTGVAMADRANKTAEQGLMARYPAFFGLPETGIKQCPAGKKLDTNPRSATYGNCI